MKKNNPLVSIVIPVYNGEEYMEEAIDSALNQTYDNVEIIVINDGSTDRTEEIAKQYGNKIRYYKKENGGVSTALNMGISKMKGDFFSWLSHDDRYYPNKISVQIDYLTKSKLLNKNVITYTNYDVINESSEVINTMHFEVYKPNEHPEYAVLHGLISGISILIPKQAFKDFGVFDTKYRCIQDYLLFFNFTRKYKYIFLPDVTNSTRVHSKQVTNVNPKVLEENNFLWTYMQKELSDEAKIRLAGSKYNFYNQMYNYLQTIPYYPEAVKFSEKMAKKEFDIVKKELFDYFGKIGDEKMFSTIIQICDNDFEEFSKNDLDIKLPSIDTSKEFVFIKNLAQEIGIDNIIKLLLKENSKYKKEYEDLLNNIKRDLNDDLVYVRTISNEKENVVNTKISFKQQIKEILEKLPGGKRIIRWIKTRK